MKVFLTGGAGFIGSHVLQQLVSSGHQVTVFDNLSTGFNENLVGGCNLILGDIRDISALEHSSRSHDAIIHLAAAVGNIRSIEDPITDALVNVIGTRNVIECVKKHSIQVLIYASSAAIYGTPKYLPIDEDSPCEPDSPYGVSKLAGEKDVLCQSRLQGFRAVCLRPFNVYGVNQRYDAYGNVIPIFFHRLLKKQPLLIFGDGSQTRDFVNVRDVAAAFVRAVETEDVGGVYNIASGKSRSIKELASLVSNFVSHEVEIQHEAPRQGEVLHSSATIGKLEQKIEFSPEVSFEEGLKEYWGWYRGGAMGVQRGN